MPMHPVDIGQETTSLNAHKVRIHTLSVVFFWCLTGCVLIAGESPERTDKLVAAVEKGALDQLESLLASASTAEAVEARDAKGRSLLMLAALRGDLAVTKFLVAKGAAVDEQCRHASGNRVLHYAADSGNRELAEFLIDHGAPVNGRARNGTTALNIAASRGHLEVARLLLDRGADPNQYAYRNEFFNVFTPLLTAALEGKLPMMELLCSRGARLEQRENRGSTVLMEAAKASHPEVVKWLIQKGAKVNAIGPQGHTALIYAAYNGRTENIKLLLAAGADPFAEATDAVYPDEDRTYSAAKLAQQQNHPDALALILEAQRRLRP
jgi:ankyrin repeat protein